MMIEVYLTLSGEHTMQCDLLQNSTLETYINQCHNKKFNKNVKYIELNIKENKSKFIGHVTSSVEQDTYSIKCTNQK